MNQKVIQFLANQNASDDEMQQISIQEEIEQEQQLP
jgi:hypothetical protein